MTAVIQDNIGQTKFMYYRVEESSIRLVANSYKDSGFLMTLCNWVYIDSDNLRHRPKLSLEHLEGPPFGYPDFPKNKRATAPNRKMAFINWKIMNPSMYNFPTISAKITPKAG